MEPRFSRHEHSDTSAGTERENEGEAEKKDRAWLDSYSGGRNPLSEPFGGLVHTIKTAPGFLFVIVVVVVFILLFTFLNPS